MPSKKSILNSYALNPLAQTPLGFVTVRTVPFGGKNGLQNLGSRLNS